MSVISGPPPLYDMPPLPEVTSLAIGVFDGVHLGHQKVIRSLSGHVAVLTFEPHPLVIIAPERAPYRLTPATKKATLLRAIGVQDVVVARFDEALRQQDPDIFARYLRKTFPNLRDVAVGEGWTFGRNREGTAHRLAELGSVYGFQVKAIPPALFQEAPISSTRIRDAIWNSRFDEAREMLGWPYAVSGKVVRGSGRGRQLGFSTANLAEIEQLMPPPRNVYALRVFVPTEGKNYLGVMNYGQRPTFNDVMIDTVEVHLIDFSGDLYGLTLELFDFLWLREEQKFASLDELKAQIQTDVERARLYLGNA